MGTVASLFAGIGGIERGLVRSGFETTYLRRFMPVRTGYSFGQTSVFSEESAHAWSRGARTGELAVAQADRNGKMPTVRLCKRRV